MRGAANKLITSDARAASISSLIATMGELKVASKKEAVVVVHDDDADDTFAIFAEREKKKILDLGIEPDEAYLNAEINRRWEMSGLGKSVALKAKSASEGTLTPKAKVKDENEEPADEESPEKGSMYIFDIKLDAATAKALGVEYAGEIKGKCIYKDVETKAKAAIKPKPEDHKFLVKGAESNDDDLAHHWTHIAAARLTVKCTSVPEARPHVQALLKVFGVEMDSSGHFHFAGKDDPPIAEIHELARQMHYESDDEDDVVEDEYGEGESHENEQVLWNDDLEVAFAELQV